MNLCLTLHRDHAFAGDSLPNEKSFVNTDGVLTVADLIQGQALKTLASLLAVFRSPTFASWTITFFVRRAFAGPRQSKPKQITTRSAHQ
jgi:hypothetical protein